MNDERVALIRLWSAQCRTIRWMGAQLELSGERVRQIAVANNIARTGKKSPEYRAMQRERGIKMAMDGRMPIHIHPEHDARLEAILKAAARGDSYSDVARRLGVSRNVIAGMAHRHSIRFGRAV